MTDEFWLHNMIADLEILIRKYRDMLERVRKQQVEEARTADTGEVEEQNERGKDI